MPAGLSVPKKFAKVVMPEPTSTEVGLANLHAAVSPAEARSAPRRAPGLRGDQQGRMGFDPSEAREPAHEFSDHLNRMSQKHQVRVILIIQALLVLIVAVAIGFRFMPVGVPGEWEWNRLADQAALTWHGLFIAGAGVAIYAVFAGSGLRCWARHGRGRREAACVTGLLFRRDLHSGHCSDGAPAGYDLTKWASVNYLPGSAGYFQVARQQAAGDPWKFLAEYPDWIQRSGRFSHRHTPSGVDRGPVHLAANDGSQPAADRRPSRLHASLGRGGLSGLCERCLRVAFARRAGDAVRDGALDAARVRWHGRAALLAGASGAAGLRGMGGCCALAACPSANLFQPVADTAYPLLSTSALALPPGLPDSFGSGPGSRTGRCARACRGSRNGHGVWHVLHAGVPSGRV